MDQPTLSSSPAHQIPALPSGEHPWARPLRRVRKFISFTSLLVAIFVTLWLLPSGLAGDYPAMRLANAVKAKFDSPWVRALAYSGLLGVLYGAVGLPFSFLSGYVIQKRFGLSTQTLGGWILDQIKGLLIALVLGAIAVLGLTAALLWTGNDWWWVTSIGAALFGVVLTRLAPQLIIPLFFKMKPIESEELQRRFKSLGEKTRTPVLGVYEINLSSRTRAANAAVVGFGASRRAVVGDTLLSEFTMDEAEFVLAHELAHHRYHDLWSGIALGAVLTLISLGLTHWILLALSPAFTDGFPPNSDTFSPLVLFLIALVAGLIDTVLSPVARLFSRIAETRADRFAAKTTANAKAGAEAFRKLGYQNIAVFRPPRWEEVLFYTHPCIARRIQRLGSER